MSSIGKNESINLLYQAYSTKELNKLLPDEKKDILERLTSFSKIISSESVSQDNIDKLKDLRGRFHAEYKNSTNLNWKRICTLADEIFSKLTPKVVAQSSAINTDQLLESQQIKSKMESGNIDEKQRESSSLVTSPEVPRPSPDLKRGLVNIDAWIGAHPEGCREDVRTLINVIKHVRHAEFEANYLNITIEHLNQMLKQEDFEYVAPVEAEKSNLWMFQIAKPRLIKQPISLAPLAYPDFIKALMNKSDLKPSDFPNNLVLFDDAMYSGQQMTVFLQRVNGEMLRANKKLMSKGIRAPYPRIILACAYVTKFSINALYKLVKEQGMKIELLILNHTNIPTISEAIEDKGVIERLTTMYWPRQKKIQNDSGAESRGVVYFDHKVADRYSFPEAVAKGEIRNGRGQEFAFPIEMIISAPKPYEGRNKSVKGEEK
jgi:hypothetical protein